MCIAIMSYVVIGYLDIFKKHCGGLTLAKGPDAHPAPLSMPLLNPLQDRERPIGWKSSGVETKTGRSLTDYHHGQTRLNSGKIDLTYAN